MHGPENIALLRKIAMNLAKSERSNKRGIKAKLRLAGWDEAYLLMLLQAGCPKFKPIKMRSPCLFHLTRFAEAS